MGKKVTNIKALEKRAEYLADKIKGMESEGRKIPALGHYKGELRALLWVMEIVEKADDMELTEDPFEYAMATGEGKPVGDLMDRYSRKPVWTDKKSAEALVKFYITEFPNEEFKLVKRRKAGPVEDAT